MMVLKTFSSDDKYIIITNMDSNNVTTRYVTHTQKKKKADTGLTNKNNYGRRNLICTDYFYFQIISHLDKTTGSLFFFKFYLTQSSNEFGSKIGITRWQ